MNTTASTETAASNESLRQHVDGDIQPCPNPVHTPADPATKQAIRIVFPILMLMMLLAALDQTIVATALPSVAGDLGGLDALPWIVTAYMLTSTIAVPIYGKLGDMYGRRVMLQLAIGLFLVGSVLCGLAHSMIQLVLLRALQGLGGGGLLVLATASIGDLVTPAQRGKYQGMFSTSYALAALIGPLAGGYLVEHLSWRWIFYINVPLGALALLIIAVAFRPPHQGKGGSLDVAGIALLALALAALVLSSAQAGLATLWPVAMQWAVSATGVLALLGFVLVERKASAPVFPLALFTPRGLLVPYLVNFIVGMALFGSITFLPLYLQVTHGLSPSLAGMQLFPLLLGVIASSMISGRVASKIGRYRLLPVTGCMLAAMGMALLHTLDTHPSATTSYVVIVGLGLGAVLPILVTVVQNEAQPAQLGIATSGLILCRSVGGVTGVAVLGALFSRQLHTGLAAIGQPPHDMLSPSAWRNLPADQHAALVRVFSHACSTVYLVAAAGLLLACLVATKLRDRPLRK